MSAAAGRNVLWSPNSEPQRRFLASPCFEVMYGGEAGGGKTDCIMVAPLRYVHLKHFRAIIFRNTYEDVQKSIGERSEDLYGAAFPGAVYNRSEHTWTFPSGAKIYLSYLESDKDARKHKSQEYQFVGFDELTTFSQYQYTYLMSRLRSSHGIPVQVRSGTNPGDKGHEWVFNRFRAWLDPEQENRAKSGEVRFYALVDGKMQEVHSSTPEASSRTFIKATRRDNTALDASYDIRLNELDPIERARLKHGNWLVKPGRGKYFKNDWVRVLSERPTDITSTVRYWDLAGTEPKKKKGKDPDWSVGVKASICRNGLVLIEDVTRFRCEPGEVEERILRTAQLDGPAVRIGIEQDPGQAGKFQVRHLATKLMGFNCLPFIPGGDKPTRFGPFSAQAYNRNVAIMDGQHWTPGWFSELEQFPEGDHDDQVDATSGAFRMLHEGRNSMMDLLMMKTLGAQ